MAIVIILFGIWFAAFTFLRCWLWKQLIDLEDTYEDLPRL